MFLGANYNYVSKSRGKQNPAVLDLGLHNFSPWLSYSRKASSRIYEAYIKWGKWDKNMNQSRFYPGLYFSYVNELSKYLRSVGEMLIFTRPNLLLGDEWACDIT